MSTCACGSEAVVQWRRRLAAEVNGDGTEPVFACAVHALPPESAGHVHLAECSAGRDDGTCACPPPTAPEWPFATVDDSLPARPLPPGW